MEKSEIKDHIIKNENRHIWDFLVILKICLIGMLKHFYIFDRSALCNFVG